MKHHRKLYAAGEMKGARVLIDLFERFKRVEFI